MFYSQKICLLDRLAERLKINNEIVDVMLVSVGVTRSDRNFGGSGDELVETRLGEAETIGQLGRVGLQSFGGIDLTA